MIRRVTLIGVVTMWLAACGRSAATPPPTAAPSSGSGDPASIGRAFVDALSRGDDATAEAMEDDAMRAAAPAAKLGQLWQAFVAQYGAFRGIGTVGTTVQLPYTIATVQTAFVNGTVALNVTVTGTGLVAGLHVGQVTTPSSGPASSPASYVNPGSFTESSITVGSAPWALPGTLSTPNGPGPFPAVVLVAGSGPADRDETIGPNKPLRDLAWGLASAGIVVLRYDKRTLVYGAAMKAAEASITVGQETTDDAIDAIALLRATPKVDPGRLFLVGHSLGGYLAPRIASQVPGQLRGLVMLEANSTPLPQLIFRQEEYLASLQGSPNPAASGQLAALQAQVALAESPDLTPSTPASELPLGVPASYWLDLRTYDPLATAAGLRIPMFFSQGGRDYQVPSSELQGWQSALAGHSDVAFRVYPALDHLLFTGSGPSTPAGYTVPGQHVAAELVADVAAWITGH